MRIDEIVNPTRIGKVLWFNARTNAVVYTDNGVHHSADVKLHPEKYGFSVEDIEKFTSTDDYDSALIDFMFRKWWVRIGAHESGITIQARSLKAATVAVKFIHEHPTYSQRSPTYVDITPVVMPGQRATSYKLSNSDRWYVSFFGDWSNLESFTTTL